MRGHEHVPRYRLDLQDQTGLDRRDRRESLDQTRQVRHRTEPVPRSKTTETGQPSTIPTDFLGTLSLRLADIS